MKKILVASSALVAVAFAGQASASEKISLSVGGYMEQWMGFADQDNYAAGGRPNAFQSDTEVHFSGSTTLDNGIEVGAKIELEGEGGNSGTMVDEQYLYVNGGFGQVKLGAEDGPQTDMLTIAPSTGPVNAQDGDLGNWVDIDGNVKANIYGYSDAKKVTYYTPVLGGFRAGLSYTDDDTSENNDTANGGDSRYAAGVEYIGDFDAVSIKVSGMAEGDSDDGRNYHVGANVGFGAFSVGGSYGAANDEYNAGVGATNRATDGYDFGVGYSMDAAEVTLTYFHGEDEGGATITNAAGTVTSRGESTLDHVHLGLAYTLGAGVSWKSSVFWFENERDLAGVADNEGYGAVTGLALSF
ncbi:porin [Thalassospira lucentensis]|uniref:porin n=1 Tax=Thalassospira lucentensis TaxID=168935 RepID=UPI0003B40B0B|nr:porin [Thalassospira lucentensis]RCK19688.1 hypothetical protein TH1_20670 [Thalassospira lucentensis MCCC 1A00383 = DSM 14000]